MLKATLHTRGTAQVIHPVTAIATASGVTLRVELPGDGTEVVSLELLPIDLTALQEMIQIVAKDSSGALSCPATRSPTTAGSGIRGPHRRSGA